MLTGRENENEIKMLKKKWKKKHVRRLLLSPIREKDEEMKDTVKKGGEGESRED